MPLTRGVTTTHCVNDQGVEENDFISHHPTTPPTGFRGSVNPMEPEKKLLAGWTPPCVDAASLLLCFFGLEDPLFLESLQEPTQIRISWSRSPDGYTKKRHWHRGQKEAKQTTNSDEGTRQQGLARAGFGRVAFPPAGPGQKEGGSGNPSKTFSYHLNIAQSCHVFNHLLRTHSNFTKCISKWMHIFGNQ